MQTNAADSPQRETLWLVSHERDDPMVLVQTEYSSAEAVDALKRAIAERSGSSVHVDPPLATDQIGTRYDVQDRNGWLATFWLSEHQVASNEGMLTAVASPSARQRAHHTFSKS